MQNLQLQGTDMNHNGRKYYRRNLRLKGYDYSRPGAYFITICTHERQFLFGEISDGKMLLNRYGRVAHNQWRSLPRNRTGVNIDAFVVMPNHIHGILVIRSKVAKPDKRCSIPEIVRGYKTFSSRRINEIRGKPGEPTWQKNYWEHIIRNQDSFERIRNYIISNPLRWHLDIENPYREDEDSFDRWLDSLTH